MRKLFKESTIFNMLNKYLGVTYIYEEITASQIDQPSEILTFEDFVIMPEEWLERFLQANLEADDHIVLMIMQEIPTTEIKLIKGLNKLVYSVFIIYEVHCKGQDACIARYMTVPQFR